MTSQSTRTEIATVKEVAPVAEVEESPLKSIVPPSVRLRTLVDELKLRSCVSVLSLYGERAALFPSLIYKVSPLILNV